MGHRLWTMDQKTTICQINVSFKVGDYQHNNFVQYLITRFGFDKADELVSRYRIGTSKHWPGATVFWQIGVAGKLRTDKIMLYNKTTGKGVKEPFNYITWAHVEWKKSLVLSPESEVNSLNSDSELRTSDPNNACLTNIYWLMINHRLKQ